MGMHKLWSYLTLPIRRTKAAYWKIRLKGFGWRSVLVKPLKVNGSKNIIIGDNVTIEYKTWLASVPLGKSKTSSLVFEDGCKIGHFNHIYAIHSVVLHRNVLTADKVYISDNVHGYENLNLPVKDQPVKDAGMVEIGEGSWLGENVCVIGAKIGKHCVIGANSVVTKDIPDYSVAVGVPAKVIKQYDFDENIWKKANNHKVTQMDRGG